jgi:hypothetical protein
MLFTLNFLYMSISVCTATATSNWLSPVGPLHHYHPIITTSSSSSAANKWRTLTPEEELDRIKLLYRIPQFQALPEELQRVIIDTFYQSTFFKFVNNQRGIKLNGNTDLKQHFLRKYQTEQIPLPYFMMPDNYIRDIVTSNVKDLPLKMKPGTAVHICNLDLNRNVYGGDPGTNPCSIVLDNIYEDYEDDLTVNPFLPENDWISLLMIIDGERVQVRVDNDYSYSVYIFKPSHDFVEENEGYYDDDDDEDDDDSVDDDDANNSDEQLGGLRIKKSTKLEEPVFFLSKFRSRIITELRNRDAIRQSLAE